MATLGSWDKKISMKSPEWPVEGLVEFLERGVCSLCSLGCAGGGHLCPPNISSGWKMRPYVLGLGVAGPITTMLPGFKS